MELKAIINKKRSQQDFTWQTIRRVKRNNPKTFFIRLEKRETQRMIEEKNRKLEKNKKIETRKNIYNTIYRALNDIDKAIFKRCFVTRGEDKYYLLASPPKDEKTRIVWKALTFNANPHKEPTFFHFLLLGEFRDLYAYWYPIANGNRNLITCLERDAVKLRSWGAF